MDAKKNQGPIRVLIVDDSPTIRTILSHILACERDITIVGSAADAFEARDLIIQKQPQVIILDINLPKVDGLTFLKKLRTDYPVPVIIFSGVAPANSHIALQAIEIGAIDVVAKPAGGAMAMQQLGEQMADTIRAAAQATQPRPIVRQPGPARPVALDLSGVDLARHVVAIGASTGGTEAIKHVLSELPEQFPPLVIVQHMPAGFTRSFAERLDQHSQLTVREAEEGDRLLPGTAWLARGDRQMGVRGGVGRMTIAYGDTEPVNRHCPSVDVLFNSVSQCAGNAALGVLLTGMGADGAAGLLAMRQRGAITIAQDEASSVVWGMPRAAYERGGATFVTSLSDIPRQLVQLLLRMKNARAAASRAT